MLQLINDNTMALISATVSPNGHTAPLLNRFFYGANTDPHLTFKNKPQAQVFEPMARSSCHMERFNKSLPITEET